MNEVERARQGLTCLPLKVSFADVVLGGRKKGSSLRTQLLSRLAFEIKLMTSKMMGAKVGCPGKGSIIALQNHPLRLKAFALR